MEQKIPCEIIRDLLPLYVDGLTCEATNGHIEEHLSGCPDCRECCGSLKASLMDGPQPDREDQKEIDYLKKVRRRGRTKLLAGLLAGVALMALAVLLKLFVWGYPVASYRITNVNINENLLSLGGVFEDPSLAYRDYRLAAGEDGSTRLVIYGCLSSFLNREKEFQLQIDMTSVAQKLDIHGMTVDRDGTIVSQLANALYGAKNPYVGDMPANGKLTQLLDMGTALGPFENELRTDAQPYGWHLNFTSSVSDPARFEAKMKGYACVLLALVDNLDEVSWTYMAENGGRPATQSGTLTAADGTRWLGADIKSFGDSPEAVQELLDGVLP